MESSGLLRKAWEKYVMEESMRPSPYICEFCGKKKYSASAMRKHEKHCTIFISSVFVLSIA